MNYLIIGENDKVKEDALAHLSDQLLVLSERIYNNYKENRFLRCFYAKLSNKRVVSEGLDIIESVKGI